MTLIARHVSAQLLFGLALYMAIPPVYSTVELGAPEMRILLALAAFILSRRMTKSSGGDNTWTILVQTILFTGFIFALAIRKN